MYVYFAFYAGTGAGVCTLFLVLARALLLFFHSFCAGTCMLVLVHAGECIFCCGDGTDTYMLVDVVRLFNFCDDTCMLVLVCAYLVF